MASSSTTVLPLPQLVDLALCAPESGVVNFTLLHSLLHVLICQLDLNECSVEFRGADSERLQNYMNTAKPGPKIVLTEYTIGSDGKQKKKGGGRRGSKSKKPSTADVTDKNKPAKEESTIKQEQSQTIVVVEKASKESNEPPQFTIALTKEQLNKMQSDMKRLQNQVKELTDLPANMGLINAIRAQNDNEPKPVLEMFQILNLVKRLDASEEALQKMASMLEDLAKETANIATLGSKPKTQKEDDDKLKDASDGALAVMKDAQELRDSIGSKGGPIEELEKRVAELEQTLEEVKASGKLGKTYSQSDARKKRIKKPKVNTASDEAITESKDKIEKVDTEKGEAEKGETEAKEGSKDTMVSDIEALGQEGMAYFQKQFKLLRDEIDDGKTIATRAIKDIEMFKSAMQENTDTLPPDMKLAQLDLKINNIVEQMNVMSNMIGQQFSLVSGKFGEAENEIAALWEKLNSGDFRGANDTEKTNSFMDIYNKLVQLRTDLDDMNEIAQKLLTDREKKQNTLDVIIEQIEMLKTGKADREDLEDALADKADACQINRKVSYDQFDAAYDDITRQLTETLEKLSNQEDLWSQALTDVQREIGNKLDKMELTPLKDFINLKLKNIQEKFKKISAMKQEHEAAGSKSKYLKNVNCISCDSPVIMRKEMDPSLYPKPHAVPPTKSMGPYLAYELDQLRQQAKNFAGKNMNMFEGAIHYGKQKIADKDHICNRYCGGSHTVTTPQQRVTRIGHFMEQWGPEITPVEDVLIKGRDGQLYRGNADAVVKKSLAEKTSATVAPPSEPLEPVKPARAVSVPVAAIDRGAKGSLSQRESLVQAVNMVGEVPQIVSAETQPQEVSAPTPSTSAPQRTPSNIQRTTSTVKRSPSGIQKTQSLQRAASAVQPPTSATDQARSSVKSIQREPTSASNIATAKAPSTANVDLPPAPPPTADDNNRQD